MNVNQIWKKYFSHQFSRPPLLHRTTHKTNNDWSLYYHSHYTQLVLLSYYYKVYAKQKCPLGNVCNYRRYYAIENDIVQRILFCCCIVSLNRFCSCKCNQVRKLKQLLWKKALRMDKRSDAHLCEITDAYFNAAGLRS